jgi:[citrate (pro-3S)-lyase] ligase
MSSAFHTWDERTLSEPGELAARRLLLESRGLSIPGGEDLVLGFFEGERLAATGSLVGDIVQGVAVERESEGEGGAASVVTALIKAAMERGMRHLFLYSKLDEATRFEALGFSLLAKAGLSPREEGAAGPGAALLEWGEPDMAAWLKILGREAEGRPGGAGAVVVNCNPFTLGHRYLIERAAAAVPWLYVLVVEEDRSLFPFAARIELVRQGTRDIANLSVIPGGPYVISAATFPSYFLRPEPGAVAAATELHAALDLALFRSYIAPRLRVAERFVGTEPFCPTTLAYNRLMKEILPGQPTEHTGLAVHELPRLEREGIPVSASRVRDLIRKGSMGEVEALVPPTTWEWLLSPEAAPVLARIRASDSRH